MQILTPEALRIYVRVFPYVKQHPHSNEPPEGGGGGGTLWGGGWGHNGGGPQSDREGSAYELHQLAYEMQANIPNRVQGKEGASGGGREGASAGGVGYSDYQHLKDAVTVDKMRGELTEVGIPMLTYADVC